MFPFLFISSRCLLLSRGRVKCSVTMWEHNKTINNPCLLSTGFTMLSLPFTNAKQIQKLPKKVPRGFPIPLNMTSYQSPTSVGS